MSADSNRAKTGARGRARTAVPSGQRPNAASDRSNRSRLLHAATDSFAELGYEGTSLRQIADDAGVSFQLITYYFGSKEELWIATVDYLFERYIETGRGLGFTPTANLHEQFHNHMRLLLTDVLQRPQLRRITVQEFLANSSRYEKFIRPKLRHFHATLAAPYYEEVVRLGIVTRFTPGEIGLIFSSIVQNNLLSPHMVELATGIPTGTPKSIEEQVDLVYGILVGDEDGEGDVGPSGDRARAHDAEADANDSEAERRNVYALESAGELTAESSRLKQLEAENSRLKQIVGNLTLEKQLLADRLGLLKRGHSEA